MMDSSCWLMNWPQNIWVVPLSSGRETQCLPVSSGPRWSDFRSTMKYGGSNISFFLFDLNRYWMLMNPTFCYNIKCSLFGFSLAYRQSFKSEDPRVA